MYTVRGVIGCCSIDVHTTSVRCELIPRSGPTAGMENFSKQILRLGAMKGFRHVSFYLRGREELLVTVGSPVSDTGGAVSAEQTVFLLAGYELYQRPYVWVSQPAMGSLWPSLFELTIFWCRLQLRSASTVLSLSESAEDMPLTLATTERWPHADPHITIWEIVAELVSLCITPTPTNPFEIAAETLEGAWMGLPPTMRGEAMTATEGLELTDLERALNYGAVASLLHEIFLSDAPYAPHGMQALRLMQLAPHTFINIPARCARGSCGRT